MIPIRTLRTISVSLLCVLLCVGMFAFSAGCVDEKPTYTACLNPALFPFSSVSVETGETEGIDVDLLNAIGKDQGISFIYIFGSITEAREKLESREIDVGTAVFITPERKEIFLFTDPYITEGLGVITKKNRQHHAG